MDFSVVQCYYNAAILIDILTHKYLIFRTLTVYSILF